MNCLEHSICISLEIRTHLDIESFVLSGEHGTTYRKKPVWPPCETFKSCFFFLFQKVIYKRCLNWLNRIMMQHNLDKIFSWKKAHLELTSYLQNLKETLECTKLLWNECKGCNLWNQKQLQFQSISNTFYDFFYSVQSMIINILQWIERKRTKLYLHKI